MENLKKKQGLNEEEQSVDANDSATTSEDVSTSQNKRKLNLVGGRNADGGSVKIER